MKNLIRLILVILCFSITLSCGYKVVNKLNKNNYTIAEIATSGAPRISYTIKNRLIFNSSKESNNVLTLNINVDKKRIVKNKNIKNEITDYEIVISTEVKYSLLGKTKETRFIFTAKRISSTDIKITITFFLFKNIPRVPNEKIIAPKVK